MIWWKIEVHSYISNCIALQLWIKKIVRFRVISSLKVFIVFWLHKQKCSGIDNADRIFIDSCKHGIGLPLFMKKWIKEFYGQLKWFNNSLLLWGTLLASRGGCHDTRCLMLVLCTSLHAISRKTNTEIRSNSTVKCSNSVNCVPFKFKTLIDFFFGYSVILNVNYMK